MEFEFIIFSFVKNLILIIMNNKKRTLRIKAIMALIKTGQTPLYTEVMNMFQVSRGNAFNLINEAKDEILRMPQCTTHLIHSKKNIRKKQATFLIMKTNKEYRFKDNQKEKEMHDKFIEMLKDNRCLSAIIFGWQNDNQTIPERYLTDDEENICLNLVQWLGSTVGQSFLRECGFSLNVA